MRLSCPRCQGLLAIQSGERCAVAQCRDCGGLWLSAEAADTVMAALDVLAFKSADEAERNAVATLTKENKREPIACPECASPCVRFTIASVDVDHCSAHGTWYDAGELKRVRAELARDRPHIDAVPVVLTAAAEPKKEMTKLQRLVHELTKMRGPESGGPAGLGHWTTWGDNTPAHQHAGESDSDFARRYDRDYGRGAESTAFQIADALFDIGDFW